MLEYEAGKRLSQHWHERPIFSLKTGFLTGCVRMPKSTLHLIKQREIKDIYYILRFSIQTKSAGFFLQFTKSVQHDFSIKPVRRHRLGQFTCLFSGTCHKRKQQLCLLA